MTVSLELMVPLFLISAAVGVFASETKRQALLTVFKPLTTVLLLAVVGSPRSQFAELVDVGIVFSLAGDVALLSPSKKAFLAGLALFLVAHAAYIVGFILVFSAAISTGATAGGAALPPVAAAAVVMAIVTVLLLRKLWAGSAGLRAPMVGYALALALMVVSAIAATAVGSGEMRVSTTNALVVVSPIGALGAALFYASDASLAVDRFARPIKHAPLLTLGLYWLGQLGIALAARFTAAG